MIGTPRYSTVSPVPADSWVPVTAATQRTPNDPSDSLDQPA